MDLFADAMPSSHDGADGGTLAAESFWAWEQDRQLRYTHVMPVATAPSLDPRRTIGLQRWQLPGAQPLDGTWADHRNAVADRLPFQNFRYLICAGREDARCLAESGEPRFDAAGNFAGYRGTTRDITQQWHQQCRLQEAERLLQMAAAIAGFGAWSVEVATRRLTWTREAGPDRPEQDAQSADAPQHILERYAPAHREILREAYRACVRDGTPFDLELQALTAQGPRWLRVSGVAVRGAAGDVVRIQGAYQDIHKAKLAAEELREGEQRLRMTLDSLADGFITLEREWRITYMNPAAEAILALQPGALLGKSFWDAFPEAKNSVFELRYREAMDEARVSRFEAFYAPLSMWVRVSAFPSRQGIAISFTDITAARQAREQLLQANAQLEARVQERTAELRDANEELASFTEAVAQDLRVPLESMEGFSRALAERLPAGGDDRLRHYAARIRAGVSRMGSLLDALLELSQVGRAPLHPRRVNLSALALCTMEALRATEPGRDAQAEVQDGLQAWGDARLLRTLLEHLIGNAWKFSADQRPARISVGRREDGAFFVRDNGAGFDAARARELFAPFRRLHAAEEFPGMGMGLASARRVVQRHGGRIWAETGDGAVFYFTLAPGPDGS